MAFFPNAYKTCNISMKSANHSCNHLMSWLLFSAMSYILFGWCTPHLSSWGGELGYDACIYHLIGREWMNGSIPYKDFSDLKGPLIFLYYGIASLISPNSFIGISILHSMLIGIGLLFAFKSALLFVSTGIAFAVICIYFWWIRFFQANPSEIVWVLEHISLYYLLLYASYAKYKICPLHIYVLGLFIGICIALKFNLTSFFFPFVLVVMTKAEYSLSRKLFVLVLGILSILTPIVFYFYITNSLSSFINECFITSYIYGKCPLSQSALVQKHFTLFSFLNALPSKLTHLIPQSFCIACGLLVSLYGLLRLSKLLRSSPIVIFTMHSSFLLIFVANFMGPHSFLHYFTSIYPLIFLSLLMLARELQIKYNPAKNLCYLVFICVGGGHILLVQ